MAKTLPNKFKVHMKTTTPTLWRMRDGEFIEPSVMRDGHLMATIAMLRRWAKRSKTIDLVNAVVAHTTSIPEDVSDQLSRDAIAVSEMSIDDYLLLNCPPWNALQTERAKRGLKEMALMPRHAIEASAPLDGENWGDAYDGVSGFDSADEWGQS